VCYNLPRRFSGETVSEMEWSAMRIPAPQPRFGGSGKPLSWPLLFAIAVLHLGVLYALMRALAPDFTATVEREVVAAFQLEAPPPPPPPAAPDAAEQGAAGDPGREASARPVAAPSPRQVLRDDALRQPGRPTARARLRRGMAPGPRAAAMARAAARAAAGGAAGLPPNPSIFPARSTMRATILFPPAGARRGAAPR
jgi:protein TonB